MLEDGDKKDVKVSALSFPAICLPPPSRVNSNNNPHVHGLNLVDFSSSHDSTDVLIGSRLTIIGTSSKTRRLWSYGDQLQIWLAVVRSNIVRHKFWSDCRKLDHIRNRRYWFEDAKDPLICALKKIWGTESIGIKEDLELKNTNDEFNQNVQFDGTRYEVELPWKENHPATSNDYELCVNRLHEVFAAKNVEWGRCYPRVQWHHRRSS